MDFRKAYESLRASVKGIGERWFPNKYNVKSLTSERDGLRKQVSGLESEIESFKEEVELLSANNSSLRMQVSEKDSHIVNLEQGRDKDYQLGFVEGVLGDYTELYLSPEDTKQGILLLDSNGNIVAKNPMTNKILSKCNVHSEYFGDYIHTQPGNGIERSRAIDFFREGGMGSIYLFNSAVSANELLYEVRAEPINKRLPRGEDDNKIFVGTVLYLNPVGKFNKVLNKMNGGKKYVFAQEHYRSKLLTPNKSEPKTNPELIS